MFLQSLAQFKKMISIKTAISYHRLTRLELVLSDEELSKHPDLPLQTVHVSFKTGLKTGKSRQVCSTVAIKTTTTGYFSWRIARFLYHSPYYPHSFLKWLCHLLGVKIANEKGSLLTCMCHAKIQRAPAWWAGLLPELPSGKTRREPSILARWEHKIQSNKLMK